MAERVQGFLGKVAEKLARKYGLEVARGFVLKKMERVTVDDLYKAIKEDVHSWEVADEGTKRKGRRLAGKLSEHKHELTPQRVLQWLSLDRPDLGSLILNMPDKEGARWLKEDVDILRGKVWSDSEE